MATSSKGGYDCEFITAPPKSLECPICLLTVCQPHVISCCGNQFCHACIGRIQQDNKPCPLCNEVNFTTFLHKGVMREVNSLMVFCPQKKDGCDWKGELGQLEEHLNPSVESNTGKECGYVLVECRYKCGEMFLRKGVQDHESELCSKRPMGIQVVSLVKKLESLSSKLDDVIAENKKHKMETAELKAENKQLRKEISAIKKENDQLKYTCASFQSNLMPTPPYYFRICNVSQFAENYEWHGKPFYSHKEGYKLRVEVYPNGVSEGKNTHLSFYIRILCGEYDNNLAWPFVGKIRVEICDTTYKWHPIKNVIDFKEATSFNNRPTPDFFVNASWGNSQFISKVELQSYYIIRNDRISFKISAVEF